MKTSVDFLFFLRTQNTLLETTCREYNHLAHFLRPALNSESSFRRFCLEKKLSGTQPETLNKYRKVARWWCLYKKKTWYKNIKKFPAPARHRPTLTIDELQFFTNLNTHPVFDAFWLLHAYSGTRPSEVANLQKTDINLAEGFFLPQKTKTNDNQPIVILPWVVKKLQAFFSHQSGPYLFSFCAGQKPLSLRSIQKDCRRRLKIMACPKKITPHSFRHTYATIGIVSGQVPVQYMQRLLRHSRITTTMHYLDKSIDFAYQAALAHPFSSFDNRPHSQLVSKSF